MEGAARLGSDRLLRGLSHSAPPAQGHRADHDHTMNDLRLSSEALTDMAHGFVNRLAMVSLGGLRTLQSRARHVDVPSIPSTSEGWASHTVVHVNRRLPGQPVPRARRHTRTRPRSQESMPAVHRDFRFRFNSLVIPGHLGSVGYEESHSGTTPT